MCARHYYNGVGIFYNAMLANSVHKQDAMLVAIEVRSEGDTETIHKKKKKYALVRTDRHPVVNRPVGRRKVCGD